MNIAPKFPLLPQELQDEIILKAMQSTPGKAAREYYERAGMTERSLEQLLTRRVKANKKPPTPQKIDRRFKVKTKKEEKELSPEEEQMLVKLESGEVGISEMSRMVAVRVFARMLRNPDDFKFIDFFRAELLRQKEEETKMKDTHTQDMINRLFAGKLPPRFCPNCGTDQMPQLLKPQEAIVLEDE